jgi:hypothetical protein
MKKSYKPNIVGTRKSKLLVAAAINSSSVPELVASGVNLKHLTGSADGENTWSWPSGETLQDSPWLSILTLTHLTKDGV